MIRSCIILSLFLIASCASPRMVQEISLNNQSLSFTKVRLKINSNDYNGIVLKGYIYSLKDSSICFKFYGPLSIELLRGTVSRDFKVYDNFNKRLYNDVFGLIKQKSGFEINLSILQALLIADLEECKSRLLKINRDMLKIDSVNCKQDELLINGLVSNDNYSIKFIKKHLLPSKIEIKYTGISERYTIVIELFAISNERKSCNFQFLE